MYDISDSDVIPDDSSPSGYVNNSGAPVNSDGTAYDPKSTTSSNIVPINNTNLGHQFTNDAGETYGITADGTYVKIPPGGSLSDATPVSKTEYDGMASGVATSNGGTGTASSTGYAAPTTSPNLLTQLQNVLKGGGLGTAGGIAAITALSKALGGGLINPGGTTGVYRGYQGGIPQLTATRTMNQIPANYRPGGGGLSYFSPLTFTNPSGKVVSGVAGSGSPMNVGDVTGNVTGPTQAGALTPTNTNIAGGITNVGDTSSLVQQLINQRATDKAAADKAAADKLAADKAVADKLAADKAAAAKAVADKAVADKLAADKAAADKLAAETARLGTQTALGNIVAKYPNATKDPHQMTQMQVELANYMDTHGVKAADLPSILKGASYGQSWTPDIINSTYNTIDPLAQVVAAYNDKTKTPAQVAALAAQNNITTQQLQDYGVDTAGLNNLATQGYLSTPLLTSTLQQDYNAGTPAGIASINNILASNPSLTVAKIQEMFPGIDLNAVSQKGINIPGYTPTSTANTSNAGIGSIADNAGTVSTPAAPVTAGIGAIANNVAAAPVTPTYTPYTQQQMSDYVAQNNINVADPVALAQAVAATNADPSAVNAWIAQSASDNSVNGASGGVMRSHYAMGGFAPGGISSLGSYSDGGRMLKGPGDGVSDSIPAVIGGHQKAALADGEFVIPARIVSEIGNGSSDAGARKLYAMMDRIQNARKKTTKNVAANTRAEKYLPA